MEEHKRRVTAAFNLASTTYDEPALRFLDVHARGLVQKAQIHEGARVLDVATGTGKVALEAARVVGPKGRVVGVDLSEGMLAQARAKAFALSVEFRQMDAEKLDFDDAAFDVALCGFGVFFLPDMVRGIREVYRVLRPGGRLAFSTWTRQSFEPMREMTLTYLERYGISRLPPPPEPWMECREPEHLLTLLEKGGFQERQVALEPAGYFIEPEDWWTFMWGSGTRRMLSQLAPEALERFRKDILEQVKSVQNERGIWLNAAALIGTGIRAHE